MNRPSKDLLTDIFIFISSIFLLVTSSYYPAMARTFPQFVLILVAILSIGDMIYKSFIVNKTEVSEKKEEWKGEKGVFHTVILMFAYLPFILVFGFIFGTLLFLFLSTWSLGYKRIKGIIISSISSTLLMYIIFILIMKSFLPEGLLINLLRR